MTKILDLIFPQVCGICGKLDKHALCKKCEILLTNKEKLQIDKYDDKYFEEHFYLFKYEEQIRNLLLRYKFQDKPYLYETIVNFIKKEEKAYKFFEKYDTIAPVPISKKRLKTRGYNQSSLIASKLAKVYNKDYVKNSLIKTKNIVAQSTLNKEEREKNVQNVYEVKNKQKIVDKKIVLIDDIFTTGSTVNECSRILKKEGAKSIGVFTIAKD